MNQYPSSVTLRELRYHNLAVLTNSFTAITVKILALFMSLQSLKSTRINKADTKQAKGVRVKFH